MNLEFEKFSIFFFLRVLYFFQHFVIIYVLFSIINHMNKKKKPNFSFMERAKPFVVNEIKNLNPRNC